MTDVIQRAEIAAAFGQYMHPVWGVVGLYKGGTEDAKTWTCDNYHLFTALYFRMYSALPGDLDHYCKFLGACMVKTGLYARFPNRITDVSQDEIYGMCSISSVSLPEAAKISSVMLRTAQVPAEIETYGSSNWWSYDLTAPGKFTFDTFLGRFPCFIAYVKASAFVSSFLYPFSLLYWFFGFIASAFTNVTETSGKQLAYLQIPIMEKIFLGRIAVAVWRWKMKRTYPGGMRDVAKIYFPAGHPFTLYAPTDF